MNVANYALIMIDRFGINVLGLRLFGKEEVLNGPSYTNQTTSGETNETSNKYDQIMFIGALASLTTVLVFVLFLYCCKTKSRSIENRRHRRVRRKSPDTSEDTDEHDIADDTTRNCTRRGRRLVPSSHSTPQNIRWTERQQRALDEELTSIDNLTRLNNLKTLSGSTRFEPSHQPRITMHANRNPMSETPAPITRQLPTPSSVIMDPQSTLNMIARPSHNTNNHDNRSSAPISTQTIIYSSVPTLNPPKVFTKGINPAKWLQMYEVYTNAMNIGVTNNKKATLLSFCDEPVRDLISQQQYNGDDANQYEQA